jgi:hypothetical protein
MNTLMDGLKLLALFSVFTVAGCAPAVYCEGELTYQNAASIPVVQPTEGLQPRESASALKIPPAPATTVPYGETVVDAEGDERVRCLDRPPELPARSFAPEPKVEPKAEEKAPS